MQDTQVFEDGSFSAAFMTAGTTCSDIVPPTSTGNRCPRSELPLLRPSAVDLEQPPHHRSAKRHPYGVAVAAIDKYGNASAISGLVYGTPVPTVDFYTQYKNAGGAAQGGFCSLASVARDPGLLAASALALLGLLAWRRRKRGRPGAGPLAVLLVASVLAAARRAPRPSTATTT